MAAQIRSAVKTSEVLYHSTTEDLPLELDIMEEKFFVEDCGSFSLFAAKLPKVRSFLALVFP